MAFGFVRGHKYRVFRVWVQSHESFLVLAGFNCINQPQVIEVVDIGSGIEYDYDPTGLMSILKANELTCLWSA